MLNYCDTPEKKVVIQFYGKCFIVRSLGWFPSQENPENFTDNLLA